MIVTEEEKSFGATASGGGAIEENFCTIRIFSIK